MLKSRAAILASVLIMGALNIPVQAAIVYDNGGPTTTGIGGSPIWDDLSVADDFTLEADAEVTGVGFYYQDFVNLADWDQDFNYAIYANNGGLLGALLASGSAQNPSAADSGLPWCCGDAETPNAYLVTFNLQSAFFASAGTTYWLELYNGGGFWLTSATNATNSGTSSARSSSGPLAGEQMAFHLTDDPIVGNTVPEPSTLGIVGLGMLAVPLMRRFRKSASN